MMNLLMRINFWLVHKTESTPKEQRTLISKILLNGSKRVIMYVMFWYLKVKHSFGMLNVNSLQDDDTKPIVSVTTFPARIANLWMVIYTIYRQTFLPGKIVVTLAKDEFPNGLSSIPDSLKFFLGKGTELLFVDDNLRPHNKYFYSRQKYPNRMVITIDDDLLYYNGTLEKLMNLHKQYPEAICTNRAHKIILEGNKLGLYSAFENTYNEVPSHFILALGVCGVLYPATFSNIKLYDKEKIKDLSLTTDDLWLKVMEILSDTKAVVGDYYAIPISIPSSQKVALKHINNSLISQNDINLKKLDAEFNFVSILTGCK